MTYYSYLNDTYISDRLKNKLLSIGNSRITTLIAPTGYGKTTAIKWWDHYRKRYLPGSRFYPITLISPDLTEFWRSFCRSMKKEHGDLAEKMEQIGYPKDIRTMSLLMELWAEEEETQPTYFIFDDVHLLMPEQFLPLLLFLAKHLPRSIHIVLLSRNQIFTEGDRLNLGRALLEIQKEDLRLTAMDILSYAKRCKLPLSENNANRLAASTEGWISLIYLIFCAFVQNGAWQFDTPGIDRLIEQVMLAPLSYRSRQFLTICSVTPELTEAQACYLWQEPDASSLLASLSQKNAFITLGSDGIYRYHNLLRRNVEKHFHKMPLEEKKKIWQLLGDWFVEQQSYLSAMTAYRKADAWEKLIHALLLDRGNSFSGDHKEEVREWYQNCPKEILRRSPDAILMFALECFTVGEIPDLLQLHALLLEVVEQDTSLSPEERNQYLGESQILLSFLSFNSISEMSEYHRRACAWMSRPSCLVDHNSPWTFGSPSVLMLYHSQSGALAQENQDMQACMPHYYQVTNGHGSGSEFAMLAESELLQGNLTDAEIHSLSAMQAAKRKQQYSVLIPAAFTAARIALLQGAYEKAKEQFDQLCSIIHEKQQFVLLDTLDLCKAWIYAILGQPEQIPDWITEENAVHSAMVLTVPCFFVVQNAVWAAQGAWTRLAAHSEEVLTACEQNHMVLGSIYAHIQLAAAYTQLSRETAATAQLEKALTLALSDQLLLPFSEYEAYIAKPLADCLKKPDYAPAAQTIYQLAEQFQAAKQQIAQSYFGQTPDYGLTERERDVALLAAQRKSTKEIAQALFLSENTVRNHLNHIFDKLNITGTAKHKRNQLAEILQPPRK
jgi:LuxR family maltose regulon positive regulatory protein